MIASFFVLLIYDLFFCAATKERKMPVFTKTIAEHRDFARFAHRFLSNKRMRNYLKNQQLHLQNPYRRVKTEVMSFDAIFFKY